LIQRFIEAFRNEAQGITDARDSLESHLIAFAAEKSRLDGTVIDMESFRQLAEHV
jgi:hypothetical protein